MIRRELWNVHSQIDSLDQPTHPSIPQGFNSAASVEKGQPNHPSNPAGIQQRSFGRKGCSVLPAFREARDRRIFVDSCVPHGTQGKPFFFWLPTLGCTAPDGARNGSTKRVFPTRRAYQTAGFPFSHSIAKPSPGYGPKPMNDLKLKIDKLIRGKDAEEVRQKADQRKQHEK